MDEYARSALGSVLLRTLELEPCISAADAVERVLELAPQLELLTQDRVKVEQYLLDMTEVFQQRAVVNPSWLASEHNLHYYFYLVNAQPTWLQRLVQQTSAVEFDLSHYILYGVWDSLLVLCGREQEARDLRKRVEDTMYHDFTHFSTHSIHLFHRYPVGSPTNLAYRTDLDVLNQLVVDYGADGAADSREELLRRKVLLGPVWQPTDACPELRVEAFVGVNLHGGSHEVSPEKLLKHFQSQDVLHTCLVHLFEVHTGYPFHYMAKLVCRDTAELDEASDQLTFTRIGRVGVEGSTFVVASGREQLPNLPPPRLITLAPSPDIRQLEDFANTMLMHLGGDSTARFNALEPSAQLLLLLSYQELKNASEKAKCEGALRKNIASAVDSFARTLITNPSGQGMAGPVLDLATVVEEHCRHVLRLTTESVYGNDYKQAQKALKLPTWDIRKLALGKVIAAFREIRQHASFEGLHASLTLDMLDRLDEFSAIRNNWAHGRMPEKFPGLRLVDEARRAMVEAIGLLSWLCADVGGKLPTETALEALPEKRSGRERGIFVSYSSSDGQVAERIANGLKALGYRVWYAEWEIAPGDSIVEKINDALARNDTLLLLLSPNSVNSRWVQRELDTALMAQLRGQDVVVVPMLIEECDIPAVLATIKWIDITSDFQAGFIKLLDFLQQRGADNE